MLARSLPEQDYKLQDAEIDTCEGISSSIQNKSLYSLVLPHNSLLTESNTFISI